MAARVGFRILLLAGVVGTVAFVAQHLVFGAQDGRSEVLHLVTSIPLPGISGDFDHFAVDEAGHRLFLAGEDHQTLEVFDLNTEKHLRSISGFGTPHSVFYLPKADEILVTDGGEGVIQVLRGRDYAFIGRIEGLPAVDSARIDPATQTLYAVTGGKDLKWDHSFLVAIDLATGKKVGQLRFESNHVEAMALESTGPRLFINLTDKAEVAVVNRKTMKVMSRWPVQVAGENSPMAFDEAHHRLFLACRKPASLVVMDSDSGAIVAHFPAAARSDDIAFDTVSGRIYVPGGDGFLSVFKQKSPTQYIQLANLATATGAKTCLLVSSLKRYFVAVSPGDTKTLAKLLIFDVP